MESSMIGKTPAFINSPATGYADNLKKSNETETPAVVPSGDQVTITGSSAENTGSVKVSKMNTFSQDPFVDKPAPDSIEKEKIGKELKGPRVYAFDSKNPIAIADPDGNYFYSVDEPAFNQVNAFVVTYKTIDMLQDFAGRKIDWSFGDEQMGVNAHSGEGANAYYARWQKSTHFLSFHSSGLKKRVNTSQSAEIVSHETGHAGLDGMRPRYISSWDPETRAIHEGFADSTAMLYTLSKDDSIRGIVEETGGNLSKSNRLAFMGEEFGASRRLSNTNPDDDKKTYLRNALNTFKYKPPSELPEKAGEDELASESHSYSRVFSGAFYDIINTLNNRFMDEGQKPEDSLKQTGNVLGSMLVKAIDMAPTSSINFKTTALCMMKAGELLYGGKFKKEMADVFVSRNILKTSDIKQLYEERHDPSIVLKGIPASGKEAMEFLKKNSEALGVDSSEFSQAEIVTDKHGNCHLAFTESREISLGYHQVGKSGKKEEVITELYGGLTLTFDKKGRLEHRSIDRIDESKIQTARKNAEKSFDDGTIRNKILYKNENIFKSKGTPYEGEISRNSSGKVVLTRIPVIVN